MAIEDKLFAGGTYILRRCFEHVLGIPDYNLTVRIC